MKRLELDERDEHDEAAHQTIVEANVVHPEQGLKAAPRHEKVVGDLGSRENCRQLVHPFGFEARDARPHKNTSMRMRPRLLTFKKK